MVYRYTPLCLIPCSPCRPISWRYSSFRQGSVKIGKGFRLEMPSCWPCCSSFGSYTSCRILLSPGMARPARIGQHGDDPRYCALAETIFQNTICYITGNYAPLAQTPPSEGGVRQVSWSSVAQAQAHESEVSVWSKESQRNGHIHSISGGLIDSSA
ncbi:hypothetical protein BJX61DRAFT_262668 [Aspergillus egyptiacus]|nr:hypothetical protein BJX61DRAFT_262668 [Aspergillus egyptiacus]